MNYIIVFVIGVIFGAALLAAIAFALTAGDADRRMGCK